MPPRARLKHFAAQAAPYALLAVAAAIVAPVFMRGLACSDDAIPHLARALQLNFNLRGGAPWLQWAPDQMRGYGYPVFVFYAPLAYWLLAGLHALGLGFSAAERLLFFAAVLGAGWSAYTLGRCWLGARGAFVSGLAYLFAPYILYDAIQRGALPESLALAWLPLVLAAFYGLAQQPTWRRCLWAAAALAGLIFLHNLVPLLALPMIAVLGLTARPGASRVAHVWRRLWAASAPLAASVALALGLSAGFWLPALLELRYTLSGRAEAPAAELRDWPRYQQNFVPLARLVGWPAEPGDPALLNAPVTRVLGVGQTALALAGLLAIGLGRDRRLMRPALVWAGLALTTAWFAADASAFVWDALPPLQAVQLPTRFLGLASLCLAVLGGLGVEALLAWRPPPAWQTAALAFPAVAVAASGWAWLQPRYCPVAEPVTRAHLAQALTADRWMIEPLGELLPAWVDGLPPEQTLIAKYDGDRAINRLAWPAETVTLAHWTNRPGYDEYALQMTAAADVLYQSFYFPGWQARLDGQPIPIEVTRPEGLMRLRLPAGEHRLELRFQRTAPRWLGLAVSAGAVLICMTVVAIRRRRLPPMEPSTTAPDAPVLVPLAGVTALLLLLYFGLVQQTHNPIQSRRWQADGLLGVPQSTGLNFSGELRHLGYSLAPATARAGQPLVLTQYWSALTDLGVPYGMAARVVDDDGRVWSTPLARPYGYADFPSTESWPLAAYARDVHQLRLLAGTPPGRYWLETSVFRRDVVQTLMPAAGVAVGADPAYARLGPLTVASGLAGVTEAEADVDVFAPAVVAPGLNLLGWTAPSAPLASGDRAHVELLWSATAPQPSALAGTLALIDSAGQTAAERPFALGGRYPTEAWPPHSVVRDQLDWRLSPALPTGAYTLQLRLGTGAAVTLGQVSVTAPQRSFAAPALEQVLDERLGFVRLAGFTVSSLSPRAGESLALTLGWQALAETEISYRVFVHVRAAEGGVRAQADGVPVSWTRPTTGWLPGEYLVDTYSVTLPADMDAGAYQLVVGLYDPATGERLAETTLATLAVR